MSRDHSQNHYGPNASMDWIDKAIRDLCELPDRDSPEDDPAAIVATPIEIRAAIEANMPRNNQGETK